MLYVIFIFYTITLILKPIKEFEVKFHYMLPFNSIHIKNNQSRYFTIYAVSITQAPSKLLVGTFDDVINFFKFRDYWNDMALTRAIFLWVVHQDIYNLKAADEPPPNSPLEFFIKMQTSQGGYAHLIWGLCK